MALLKKKNEEKELPPPPPVIHRHEPSPFAQVLARVAGGIVAVIAFWLGTEFLLAKAGFRA